MAEWKVADYFFLARFQLQVTSNGERIPRKVVVAQHHTLGVASSSRLLRSKGYFIF
jgi:hypothetical protein